MSKPTPLIIKICPQCGGEFQVKFKERHRVFCGHRCAASRAFNMEHIGGLSKLHAKANGDRQRGTGKTNGYVKRGGRHEHRVVMEELLGRPLTSSEIVHHKDEVKRHNSPDNLVLTDRSAHARHHFTGIKRPLKTVCKFGHPLSGDNVVITWAGRRRCLTCQRRYDNEWHKAKRHERMENQ